MFEEDLDVFFDGLDSKKLRFSHEGKTWQATCYFDNAFFDVSVGETVLDTTQPRITAKYSEVKDVPREAEVMIDGKRYSVTQVQPEGTGCATVTLAHE